MLLDHAEGCTGRAASYCDSWLKFEMLSMSSTMWGANSIASIPLFVRWRPSLIEVHTISACLLVLYHLELVRRYPERVQDLVTKLQEISSLLRIEERNTDLL